MMMRCLVILATLHASYAFSLPATTLLTTTRRGFSIIARRLAGAAGDGNDDSGPSVVVEQQSSSSSSAVSLAEKMKSWEATEDEIRSATLGGIVPGGLSAPGIKGFDGKFGDRNSSEGGGGVTTTGAGRTDAFDVGLYIAFPIMVLSCLAFVFFPFLINNIDVNSVGPPPMS
jgi:hypothetical protein